MGVVYSFNKRTTEKVDRKHGDPRGRQLRGDTEEAGGGKGGGRYKTLAAAKAAAVT
jgi:hypothetical protein